jgi:serine/threonine-protein kinase Chk2
MQGTVDEDGSDLKKPRRSERLSGITNNTPTTPISTKKGLPSPMTHQESTTSSDAYKEATATPPEGRPSQILHRTPECSPIRGSGLTSPPQDTQAFSQFVHPKAALSEDVEDEIKEGVWGYLLPLDAKYGDSLVLRKRNACPMPDGMKDFGEDKGKRQTPNGKNFEREEEAYEETKLKGIASGGYLIGRHPECGKKPILDMVSNCGLHF